MSSDWSKRGEGEGGPEGDHCDISSDRSKRGEGVPGVTTVVSVLTDPNGGWGGGGPGGENCDISSDWSKRVGGGGSGRGVPG